MSLYLHYNKDVKAPSFDLGCLTFYCIFILAAVGVFAAAYADAEEKGDEEEADSGEKDDDNLPSAQIA